MKRKEWTKMKKTLVAILASLAMVITMIPLSAVTVSAGTPPYPSFTLYYNSGEGTMHTSATFTDANKVSNVLGWKPDDSDNRTLILDGFNFTTTAEVALVVPAGTTINLQNDNFIVSTPAAGDSTGIETTRNEELTGLTFTGDGTIKVTAGKAIEESMGILSEGKITVSSGIVEATGGEVTEVGHASYGIYANTGGIEVSGGKLTATGGSGSNIKASNGAFTNGNITVSGGELTAIGGSASDSYGAFTTGDITVSGGKLTATGGSAEGSYGLYQSNESEKRDINISGGEITATGLDAEESSFGLFSDGDIIVSKGKVIATSGDCTHLTENNMQEINSDSYSMGVILGGTITKGLIIKDGGSVTATAGKAGKSYGIFTPIFDFENGTVEAKASKDALESVGIFGVDTRLDTGSNGNTDSVININNKGLTAQGSTVALYSGNPDGDTDNPVNNGANIKDGIYAVGSTNYDGKNAKTYRKAINDSYKYVSTATKKKTPAPSPADSKNGDGNSDSTADTGDSINLALPIGLAIAALLAVAALIITRKVNRKK